MHSMEDFILEKSCGALTLAGDAGTGTKYRLTLRTPLEHPAPEPPWNEFTRKLMDGLKEDLIHVSAWHVRLKGDHVKDGPVIGYVAITGDESTVLMFVVGILLPMAANYLPRH